jgi:hypothetical protein
MAAEKQDANLVGFYKIRESVLGVVPATGNWQTREPNSFDDMGGEYTKTARRPFSPSRQRKKGSTTDLDADGGYNEDLTLNNMQTELEEFFFAAIRKTPERNPTAVTATQYTVASSTGFLAGSIVFAKGFGNAANNGVKVLSAVSVGSLTAPGLAVEASPPAGALVKQVGFTFPTGDVVLALITGGFRLTCTAANFTDHPLIPGQWVFLDIGDAGETNTGYARIAVGGVSTKTVTFDKSTWTPVANPGTGLVCRIYFGDVLKNEEDPALIVRYSSTIERTLGRDDVGVQSEFLTGAVANELTWNSPLAGLVSLDLSYIAQRVGLRNGTEGPLSSRASNTIRKALSEDAFNTSSNLFRIRMGIVDPLTLNPTPLFARVTEWSLTLNNNVTAAKAQGVLGGFDTIAGNFDVDGEFTAYFSTTEAIHAVKCNSDVTFDAIYAKQNAGVYIDLPLVSLGGGRLDIEQDAAIMLPLEAMAAESPFGHTALIGWFTYLPNEAMPDQDC